MINGQRCDVVPHGHSAESGVTTLVDALITALKKDKQGVVRQEAAIALGTIKSQKSVESFA